MTESPSEAPPVEESAGAAADFAAEVAAAVGGTVDETAAAKVYVDRGGWREAVAAARDLGLDFFSWLSAVDYTGQVAVGDPHSGAGPDAEGAGERYEVLCRLSTVVDNRGAILATVLPKDDAVLDSLIPVFGGADWHEREAREMFGIDFTGHPRMLNLYLPDGFEGHPLRKSYPLLSREVKPWPGLVDVEAMPSTDNPEAGGDGAAQDGAE